MSNDLREQLQQAHAQGDYAPLLALIPYAGLIGIECSRVGDELLFKLPANKDNIGNPLLPAIHGGVIAGFMELAAALHLLIFTGTPGVPKIIDFSLDYLRAGQFRDTWAGVRSAVRGVAWPTLRSRRGRVPRANRSPPPARTSKLMSP